MSAPQEFDAPTFERFTCPGCDEDVDVPSESSGKLVRCPYCNTDFFASVEQSQQVVVDDTNPQAAELDREAAFDKLRILKHTRLRMAAIRARSWWLIACILALLLEIDMGIFAVIDGLGFHRWWSSMVRLTICVLAGLFARHARRRAAEFKKESEQTALPEPTVPPDFSTLNDGRDRWKELENIR
jgi:hypothetical protein